MVVEAVMVASRARQAGDAFDTIMRQLLLLIGVVVCLVRRYEGKSAAISQPLPNKDRKERGGLRPSRRAGRRGKTACNCANRKILKNRPGKEKTQKGIERWDMSVISLREGAAIFLTTFIQAGTKILSTFTRFLNLTDSEILIKQNSLIATNMSPTNGDRTGESRKEGRDLKGVTSKPDSPSPLSLGVDTERSEIGVLRMHLMPMPGSVGAPFLGGKNVTEFLTHFEDLCSVYGVVPSQKVAQVVRYCSVSIGHYLRTMPAFIDSDWEELKASILSEWKAEDDEPKMRTMTFLGALKSKP